MKRNQNRTARSRPGLLPRMAFSAALLLAAGTGVVQAGSASWTNLAAGSWNVNGNWVPAAFPNTIDDVASVTNNITAASTISLNVPITIGALNIGDGVGGFFAFTIATGTGGTLTFDTSAGNATITKRTNTVVDIISAPITLNDNLDIDMQASSGGITLSGNIDDAGPGKRISELGTKTGILTLSGYNTFGGGVTLRNGYLTLGSSTALGSGTFCISNGVLNTSVPNLVNANNNAQNWNTNFTFTGTYNMDLGAGAVTLNAATCTVTATANTLTVGGAIGGANYGLTKTGAGTLALTGTNSTYSGKTRISAGTLRVTSLNRVSGGSASSSLGAPITVANGTIDLGATTTAGTLRYTGAGETSDRVINLAGTTGGGVIQNDGSGALILTSTNTNTGVGIKTLTLQGSNTDTNTFAGNIVTNNSPTLSLTKAGAGTWVLKGANTFTNVTAIAGGGTLVLDYATQNNSKLSTTAALTLGGKAFGGALTLSGGSYTQVVLSTTLSTGTFSVARSSGASILRMNTITRVAGGTIDFAANSIADTDNLATNNSILGGWATVAGTNWATNSTGAADGPITAYTSYTVGLPTSGGASNINYSHSGAQTNTGAVLANTLKLANSDNSQILALGTNKLTFTWGSAIRLGGLLYVGGSDNLYTISGTNIIGAGAAYEFIINVISNGTLTISAKIIGSGAGSLTKTGSGKLVLTTNSLFTGAMRINQGVVNLQNATASGTTAGGISVAPGAALELQKSGSGIMVGAEKLSLTGTGITNAGALRNISGTNTYAGAITLGVDGNGARINSDSGTLTLSGGIVTAAGTNLTIGGAGTVSNITASISGAGNIIKDGSGTLALFRQNTFSGTIRINAGIVKLGQATGLGPVDSATVLFGNSSTGKLQLNAISPTIIGLSGDSTATVENGGAAVSTLTVNNAGDWTYAGLLTNGAAGPLALTKTGPGKLTLSNVANTYTNATTINAGILSVSTLANGGVASSIGASATNAAYLVLGGGRLQYTGGTVTINRSFTLSNMTNSTIEITETNTTLTISGASANTTGNLTKTGPGTLVLSGANLHTGTTRVKAGTLRVNGSLRGGGQVTAINSGTLAGTGTVAGAVFIYAGGILAPGSNSIGILTVTNGVTFTGGTFDVKVTTTNSGEYGRVKVTDGNVLITNGATLAVSGSGGYTPGDNDYIWIINNTNVGTTVAGTFAGLPEDGETNIAGAVFTIHYDANFDTGATSGGNDVLLAAKPSVFYFVGTGGNWDVAANWATSSGGAGGAGIPNANVPVIFDANSTGNCTLVANAAAKSINTTGFTNTLALGAYDLSVAQNLLHAGGKITIGASASAGLDVAASITNSATIVCSGTSKISCGGNWNGSSGTFTAGTSIVTLDGANAQVVTTGGAWNAPTTNNNWKNNWYELNVLNTNGVTFADGFKTGKFIATNAGAKLYFKWQEAVTNVFNITNSYGLNIQGTASKQIQLNRFGGSYPNRWEIYPSHTSQLWTVTNIIVNDSVNSASNHINPGATSSGTNTLNWFTYTLVTLGWFEAIGRDNSVTVRWKTESEVNNAGFNIYRSLSATGAYTRVNAGFIWGLGTSSRGSEYAFIDNAVTNGGTYYYKLEAIEFDGKSTFYGPAVAYPGLDTDGDGMTDDWELFYGLNVSSNDASADLDLDGFTNYYEFLADTNPKITGGGGWGGGPPSAPGAGDSDIFKIAVLEDGVYRLTHGYLETDAGITNLSEWTMDNIRMYNQGSEIQLYVHNEGAPGFETNDYVEFYGTRLDSRFTDANVYWLYCATNAGSGLRMAEIAGTGGSLKTNYWHTERFEENKFYRDALPDETADDDHWFFTNFLYAPKAPPATAELKPVLANISGVTTTAQIRVAFRGINYTTPHHVEVNINGYSLPDGSWSGDGQYAYSATTAQSNLVEGTNTVLVTLPGDTGAAVEQVLINWVEIDYAKNLEAVSNSLIFTLSQTETNEYAIAGYTTNDLQVFKVVNSTNVAIITNLSIQGTGPYAAVFSDNGVSGITYAVVGPDGRKTPASIVEDAPSDLRSTTNGADYIIITYDDFYDAVQPLASYRQSEGMRVKVVRIQDVYDDFNFGIVSPYAIRDFLSYARLYWNSPSPTYVALVGDASYDYKDNEAKGTVNYVPVKMAHDAESLETPCDNWYVALDGGSDFMADMYIGRLPARTTNEVTTLVNKIIDYEGTSAEASWARNVMLVADDEPWFEEMNESVAAYLPAGYQTNRIYLSEYLYETNCTSDIIAGFNNGALITHYAGHGSTKLWAHEYIFDTGDIPSLTNGVRLPLVVTPTCYNGYFLFPGADNDEALAEELVRKTNGGAIACFSPAGMSTPPQQEILADGLFEAIFDEGCFQLGPAITRAKLKTYQQLGGDSRNIVEIFILFGDPALRLKKWSGYTGDTNPPAITQTSPTNGSITVGITDDIRITFSEAMDDVMTRAAFSISPQVTGSFSWDGTALVFDPQGPLTCFTTYTVEIASNACDLAGNLLTNNNSFTFTPSASISGAISYSGDQAGSIRVVVSTNAAGIGADTAGVANVTIAAPGSYTCFPVPAGTFYVWAFRDSSGNGAWDRGEAIGEYASNPIGITSNLVGIDVTLVDQDADSDGLPDYVEINIYHTNPDKPDTDSDGLTDWQELGVYSTDPNKANSDEDGLSDGEEIAIGTDPNNPDTDGDGLTDGQEVVTYLTNPNAPDTDSDGLTDFDEVFVYGTNPNDADSDHDSMTDQAEVIAGTNPNDDTSVFKISEMSQQAADTVVLECETVPGRFYRLQTTTNLVSAWTNVGEEIEGTGDIITFTNTPSEQSRFYRIKVRQ